MARGKTRRVEMLIRGRVQGVCFRVETRRTARVLGAVGVVANLPDGTVRVIAEGTEDALERLIAFCRHGPQGAIVNDISTRWQEPTGTFHEFEISH